jgi:hypothetical protein
MRETRMPPLRWIARTLRETTETLTRELASPSNEAPKWDQDEWRIAEAVAAMHGISPLLASTLRWTGPTHWMEFLARQREHTGLRHARILELLAAIDSAACDQELRVTALKGAALHAAGYYTAGERPMSDVDLLVHPSDKQLAIQVIESLEYRFLYETSKHAVFQPLGADAAARIGEHADNPIKIELHTSIAEQLPLTRSDITNWVLPEKVGLTHYRSHAALMAHLLLHAAGTSVFHGLRALHLQDFSRVASRMGRHDWLELVSLREEGRFWWAFPPLTLLERYFPDSVPDLVLDTAEDECAWLLRAVARRRSLTDVSLSDLPIHAFPGIEWSRSPTEMLRYAYTRVSPSAQTLAMRAQFASWQSLGGDDPWIRQSQLHRMLRWLVSRPPRVETMSSVRAALAMD